jgi:hypothetical protein
MQEYWFLAKSLVFLNYHELLQKLAIQWFAKQVKNTSVRRMLNFAVKHIIRCTDQHQPILNFQIF